MRNRVFTSRTISAPSSPLHAPVPTTVTVRHRSATAKSENRSEDTKLRRTPHATTFGAAPLFAASVVYVLPFYFMMVFRPNAERTRVLLSSPRVLLPVALMYCYLLIASWQSDTLQLMMPGDMKAGFKGFNPQFFPKLESIQILFSRLMTAASLWVHIVAVNFFFARDIFLKGVEMGIPVRHSCLCALFLGPIAILIASVTEAIHRHQRAP